MDRRRCLAAVSKALVCRFCPATLADVSRSNIGARALLQGNLQQQIRQALDHTVDLAKKQALEKFASFVGECVRRLPANSQNPLEIKLPMHQRDIANYLGLQPETACRCLRELVSRGIIEQPRLKHIIVKNAQALCALANGADPVAGKMK